MLNKDVIIMTTFDYVSQHDSLFKVIYLRHVCYTLFHHMVITDIDYG